MIAALKSTNKNVAKQDNIISLLFMIPSSLYVKHQFIITV